MYVYVVLFFICVCACVFIIIIICKYNNIYIYSMERWVKMILSDQTCNCAENAGWIQPLPDDKCHNLEIYIGHLLFTPLIPLVMIKL